MTTLIKGLGNISAWDTAGNEVKPNKVKQAGALGCTLLAGTTYYFPIGRNDQSIAAENQYASAQLQWAAAVLATITIETSNFPMRDDSGALDVVDSSIVAGEWNQENPPSAYVPVAGAGNSAVAATVTAGGTNAGAATFELSEIATRRARIKVVVGGTGGVVRCGLWAKGPNS